MIGEFFSWYFAALVDFWGTALRLGIPQIVLLILILMWLRRSRCRKCGDESDERSSCWAWFSGCGGWGGRCCCCCSERGYTCCQRDGSGKDACDMGAEAEVEAEAEVVEEAEVAAEADDS